MVLNDLPDDLLNLVAHWRNEKVEDENNKTPG